MSIPIDRLYNYLSKIARKHFYDKVRIWYFFPHGSKKLDDIVELDNEAGRTLYEFGISPFMIMHDQEPLNYHLYSEADLSKKYNKIVGHDSEAWVAQDIKAKQEVLRDFSLKLHLRCAIPRFLNAWDRVLLCHSEKNSKDLDLYEQNGFVGVYWWCHAVIARDWFRYAEYLKQQKHTKKTFLIYNRSWSGTREYRLKFTDLLITADLQIFCQTTINPMEPESNIHYTQYQFSETFWHPEHVLENYFPATLASSNSSADFHLPDYEATDIEIVLETLFDDQRLHLTEKTLRPIACGQPFILAATPNSLKYLHEYGFKTFSDIWDESYDRITDAKDRLCAVVDLMKQIAAWDPTTRQRKMEEVQAIVNHNRDLFFSKSWQDKILEEFQHNVETAGKIMQEYRSGKILQESWRIRDSHGLQVIPTQLAFRQKILDWVAAPL